MRAATGKTAQKACTQARIEAFRDGERGSYHLHNALRQVHADLAGYA
jgi:hypothetical protein